MSMETRKNRRGRPEHYVSGRHLNLKDLKREARHLGNRYLYTKNVPESPQLEFHVAHLKHDTGPRELKGIRKDEGFRNSSEGSDDPHEVSLLWWSLAVGPEEVKSAETRLLQQKYSDMTEDQAAMHPSFLYKFTTSPAFSETSRLGSYRFTFPLEEVLEAYSLQFCSGDQPVMRVYETVLHKQEVQHVVLVHSPANQELFSKYPLLTDDPNAICVYKDGRFIWRPYAISETHRYELMYRPEINHMSAVKRDVEVFYIWDNVAIALHVDQQVLQFDAHKLRENLKFCHRGVPAIGTFDSFEDAEEQVKLLWPDCDSPLEEECSLEQRFTDLRLVLVGGTGSRKSYCGNVILGRDAFSTGGAAAGNNLCYLQNEKVFDWEVTIVDTPELSEIPEVKTKISECIDLLAPGPHVFLLVIKVGIPIAEQQDTITQMEEIFGRNVWRHTFMVLTYDNQSETDVQILNRTKTELQEILSGRVDNRYYILNNNRNTSSYKQVWDLLDAVAKMVVANRGQVYETLRDAFFLQLVQRRHRCSLNQTTRRRGTWSPYRRRLISQWGPSPGRLSSPSILIVGDSVIRNVCVFNAEVHSFPGATVYAIQKKLQDLLPSLPSSTERVIIHVGGIDIIRQQSEVTKDDFKLLFDFLKQCDKAVFISGPIPNSAGFSRTLSLHNWLQSFCRAQGLGYINNFNLFWNRRYLFAANRFHPNALGSDKLGANMQRAVQSSSGMGKLFDARATLGF